MNVRDIMFRDRTYLVFRFLGLRDEVSGSRSKQLIMTEKRELEPIEFVSFLFFFLFFVFLFLPTSSSFSPLPLLS